MYSNDELDDKIEAWHEGSDDETLAEYLGWDDDEYSHWAMTNEQPDYE